MNVFLVQHLTIYDNENEDVKIIGIFSSHQKAEEAIITLSELPGFISKKDGFSIDEYPVDKIFWAEGFCTD